MAHGEDVGAGAQVPVQAQALGSGSGPRAARLFLGHEPWAISLVNLEKFGFGFVLVCRSVFTDNSKNGEAQKLCRYILIQRTLIKQNITFRRLNVFSIMILRFDDMFNAYFQLFKASVLEANSASGS